MRSLSPFDAAIATLDRALSEVMIQAKIDQDAPDTATLRHHAGDLILSGVAILRRQGRLGDLPELLGSLARLSGDTQPAAEPTYVAAERAAVAERCRIVTWLRRSADTASPLTANVVLYSRELAKAIEDGLHTSDRQTGQQAAEPDKPPDPYAKHTPAHASECTCSGLLGSSTMCPIHGRHGAQAGAVELRLTLAAEGVRHAIVLGLLKKVRAGLGEAEGRHHPFRRWLENLISAIEAVVKVPNNRGADDPNALRKVLAELDLADGLDVDGVVEALAKRNWATTK